MKQFIALTAPLASLLLAFSVSAALAQVVDDRLDVVPEPATWVLLGIGLAGLVAYRWYRKRLIPSPVVRRPS